MSIKTIIVNFDAYQHMFMPSQSLPFIVAALFDKHPSFLPRFRNAWIEQIYDTIYLVVLARIGAKYHHLKEIHGESLNQTIYTNHCNYSHFENGYTGYWMGKTFFDDTFGKYYFTLPALYEGDFYKLLNGALKPNLSTAFQNQIDKIWPDLKYLINHLTVILENEEIVHKRTKR